MGAPRQGEQYLRAFLTELARPCLDAVRLELSCDADDETAASMLMSGKSLTQPVVGWRDQPHIAYAVPVSSGEQRLRIQFTAIDGLTCFVFEARYQHPKETIDHPAVDAATRTLEAAGFECDNDGYGYYWAKGATASEWAAPNDSLHRLVTLMSESIKELAASGIFAALEELRPTTPPSPAPDQGEA